MKTRNYYLWSISLFWLGFLLAFVLPPIPIVYFHNSDYVGELCFLLFAPAFVSWGLSCYFDTLNKKQLVEKIKDDVQKYIDEHPRKVDEMSSEEIIFIYNNYIKEK